MIKIFECVVGSTVYGTSTPQSDIDIKMVHVADKIDFYTNNYQQQINFDKDTVSYELSRFMELISVNNPTCLEMLFTPKEHILYMHPAFEILYNNREKFLTTKCKNTFGGYVVSQINKATALDKKMNWEKERIERKSVLDFCYTFLNQGSTHISKWLDNRNLHQKYCGLVNTPNMHDIYGVFYDFKSHIENEDTLPTDTFVCEYFGLCNYTYTNSVNERKKEIILEHPNYNINKSIKLNFKGIVSEDLSSNEVRLSSIPPNIKPITHMSFNKHGYSKHCVDYKSYTTWLNERNTQRYVDTNKHGQMIDGKNLLHCRRLLDIAYEIPTLKTINLKRDNADYLLKIRRGEVELQEIIDKAREDIKNINIVYDACDLPHNIDTDMMNDIAYNIRKQLYNI